MKTADPDYYRARQNRQTAAKQEIGPLPEPADPARRAAGIASFETFCRTYFPETFSLEWAEFQRAGAATLQTVATEGGWHAFAWPRGSGKTSLCVAGALWSLLTGRRRYVVLLGATEAAAGRLLDTAKTILQSNDTLAADFPGECFPIRALGRSTRRCEGQKLDGAATCIKWLDKKIVLPTVPRAFALGSGGVVEVAAITAAVRGMNHATQDGATIRPDLVLADDVQTRESARSPSQTQERERTLTGDVAYLAGPGVKVAIFAPATVIYAGDLADRMLDRKAHPEWQGSRVRMLESLPTDTAAWDAYTDLLKSDLRAGRDGTRATEYYRQRQTAMDAGAVATWPARFGAGELSAIQHAMNLRARDPHAFEAECQNQPHVEQCEIEQLTASEIAAKKTHLQRLEIPPTCDRVTGFIDVQGRMLYWLLAAWAPDLTGYVIDYGSFPDQRRRYYTLADSKRTLASHYKLADANAALFRGLIDQIAALASREYPRTDGAILRMNRLLVDSGWNSQLVHTACRQSSHAAVVTPSKGRGITAANAPIGLWKGAAKYGPEWVPEKAGGKGQLPTCTYNTNFWKRDLHAALALLPGSAGSLSLFAGNHEMLADHLASETAHRDEANGRTVYVYRHTPGRENHFLDCAVGAMVAASVAGAKRQYGDVASAPRVQAKTARPRQKRTIRF